MYVYVSMHMNAGAHRGQKRASDRSKLDWQRVVSHLMLTQTQVSGKALLTTEPSIPAPIIYILQGKSLINHEGESSLKTNKQANCKTMWHSNPTGAVVAHIP